MMFTGARAGQPVTQMTSTNSKPHPSNQLLMNKIKSCKFFLVREAISLGRLRQNKK